MNQNRPASRRQERRGEIRRREQRNRLALISMISLGALFIVFAIIYPQVKPFLDIVTVASEPRPDADRNTMGNPEAPIQITEYSDFQCPFCKQFFTETEPLLVQYYIETGRVYFSYRSAGNWVSANIARATNSTPKTESQDAALAAYCAADQDKFWEMHDALFANSRDLEDQGSFSGRRLRAIADTVGMDMNAWQDCYDSGTYAEQVQQDLSDAQAANIEGTPYFVITYLVNGETKTRIINGAQPFSTFQVELEAALNEIAAQ